MLSLLVLDAWYLQGHSIGGCLAMLLTIMYKQRGVLHSNNISPCYMFGSPSVFCGASCELPSNGANHVSAVKTVPARMLFKRKRRERCCKVFEQLCGWWHPLKCSTQS